MPAPVTPAIPSPQPQLVQVGAVGPMLARGGWLIVETILAPALLLFVGLRIAGPTAGLMAVLVWRVGMTVARIPFGRRIPATVLLTTGIFCARTVTSLLFASVAVYLWQPVLVSAALGLVFVVTALAGRPVTARLVEDVVTLPSVLRADPRVQRTFVEIAVLWGAVQIVGAGAGAWTMLRYEIETVVLIHGALGILTLAATVLTALGWGWWRARTMTDITIRLGGPEPTQPLTSRMPQRRVGASAPPDRRGHAP